MAALALYAPGLAAQDASPGGRGFAITGPVFVALRVRDDSAASVWYQRALALSEVRHLAPGDGRLSVRILTGGNLTVELIRDAAASDVRGPVIGLFKAGFHVDDIDAAFAWLRERGVDVDQRIFSDPSLHARSFVFRDLEGNRLQVFQPCPGPCPE